MFGLVRGNFRRDFVMKMTTMERTLIEKNTSVRNMRDIDMAVIQRKQLLQSVDFSILERCACVAVAVRWVSRSI